jgi:uncharacterized protein (TIRG00374 family)
MQGLRPLLGKLVLSLAIGAIFLWLTAQGGIPLIPSRAAWAAVQWWGVAAYVAIAAATHFFRASRVRFLIEPIKPMPLREVILLNWAGFFAIFALPLRLGEFARPALTKMRQGVSISASLGTVAVERVIDGLLTSVCVAWGLFFLHRQDIDDPFVKHLPLYGYVSLSVFTAAFIALGLFLWQRALAVTLTERVVGWVHPTLGRTLAQKVASIADGLRSLGHSKLATGFLAESLLYWFANAFGMWVLARSCGLPLTMSQAIAVMGVLAIGILLPAGPGFFGNFQLAVSSALKLFLPLALLPVQGSVYIFLLYVCQAVLLTVAGVVPLYMMRLSLSDIMRPPAMTDPPPAPDRP